MTVNILRFCLIVLVLLGGFSLLGGSLFWHMLGFDEGLQITGRAQPVTNADAVPWTAYGGDPGGMRYADVHDITAANVDSLEVAWIHQTGALDDRGDAARRSSFQVTPIMVEDSLVFCTQFNDVIALSPETGEEKWRFDARLDSTLQPANGFTCRGVSYWRDASSPEGFCGTRILTGTIDARVIALDAKSGKPCPDFGENGEVKIVPETELVWPGEFQITSAPAIAGDLVIVGSAISDNLRVLAPAGTVRAFDVRSGELIWEFDPVPRSPADPAHGSWDIDLDMFPGHANVWSTMSVDPQRGLVFLPTSSSSPDFYGGLRPGDNRYTSSVVALEAATGKVIWDFQTVHHDVWDYDVPAQPGLYSVTRSGVTVDVVAQVAKTGLVFVLDRETGIPVLAVEERPVPQGGMPGEKLSPTQPFPSITPPVVPNQLSEDDAFGLTYWDRQSCKRQIAGARSEGLFTPPDEQGTILYPFTGGGANWGSAAFDPTRNLMVVNMSNVAHLVTLVSPEADADGILSHEAEFAPMTGAPYGMTRELLMSPLGLPCTPPPWGVLAGVDLDSGKIVWRTKFGSVRRFAGGLDSELGMVNLGGPMITASGLVFIGATADDYLRAFDVETGEELWRADLPASAHATPMSYKWQGREYIVIAAGGHKDTGLPLGDSIVAFALESTAD